MNLHQRYLISSTEIKHDPVRGTRRKNMNIHTQESLNICHDTLLGGRYLQNRAFPHPHSFLIISRFSSLTDEIILDTCSRWPGTLGGFPGVTAFLEAGRPESRSPDIEGEPLVPTKAGTQQGLPSVRGSFDEAATMITAK